MRLVNLNQTVDKLNFVNGLFLNQKIVHNNFVRQLIYSNLELTSLTFFMLFCYNIIGICEKVSDIMAMTKQNFKNGLYNF